MGSIWADVQSSYAAWTAGDGTEFKCEFCQAWFQIEGNLFKHVETVHGVSK